MNDNGYKGKIYFFKNTADNYYGTCAGFDTFPYQSEHYIELGSCEVDVEFTDSRDKQLAALEAQVAAKSAEHQHWLDEMSGKIQSLQALEHKS